MGTLLLNLLSKKTRSTCSLNSSNWVRRASWIAFAKRARVSALSVSCPIFTTAVKSREISTLPLSSRWPHSISLVLCSSFGPRPGTSSFSKNNSISAVDIPLFSPSPSIKNYIRLWRAPSKPITFSSSYLEISQAKKPFSLYQL